MTLQEIISRGLMRFFVPPISRNQTVDFKTHLKEAARVLISCPDGKEIFCCSATVAKFANLFPREGLIILCPNVEKYSIEKYKLQQLLNSPIHFPDVTKHSLWSIFKSRTLKQLEQNHFDLLLDLNPHFSLLNLYLCRLLRPPLRIGFAKPHSKRLYNLQYNGKPGTSYGNKLEGLLRLLQSLLS